MVVVSSHEPSDHATAQHDAPAAASLLDTHQRIPDMAAATMDAPPMPALASVADEVAPAASNLSLEQPFGNGLPALDAPIQFPQADGLNGMTMSMDMQVDHVFPPMDFAAPPPVITDERVNAFARLRFDDGSYYMHTYQIILGRNIALAHRDMRRLAKADQLHANGQAQAAEEVLNGKKDKKDKKKGKRDRRGGARSVISEKGGIVNAPIESMPMEYQQTRETSRSQSSASHPTGESGEDKPAAVSQEMLMQSFPEVPAQFDSHVPEDPNDCPTVPIHPQHIMARTGAQGPKGISRHHARIFYDFDNGNFSVEVLGSNGLHHENNFKSQGEIVPLDHGDHLLIGAVNIQFYLPDIALTDDQRCRQESGSRPMSFSFENGHGELDSDEQESSESEGELSINPRHGTITLLRRLHDVVIFALASI